MDEKISSARQPRIEEFKCGNGRDINVEIEHRKCEEFLLKTNGGIGKYPRANLYVGARSDQE